MNKTRKILVIRFSSIGDIVLTSAVVRCLKLQLPGAEVHFLTKKQFEPVVAASPYIDRIWTFDDNFRDLIPGLSKQGFDFVADLHKNYRSSIVKGRLGVKSGTFHKLNIEKWFTVNFKMKVLPEVHIVDRYFKAVESLGIINDGKGLDYFIPAAEEILMETLPVTHQQGYIAVVIGGKHNTKIFPASKVAEVCKRLALPVILLGGKEDRERGEKIAGEAGTMTYNSCGIFSLNQSASLIRQAVAVMTNDTGLMHIAAAFKKPVVSLWGNTIPGFGMYPYFPVNAGAKSMVAEVTGLSCRPCSKIGFSECPKKHFKCMNDISIEPVVEFLDAEFENRKS